ncbi:MAG TPA: ATP-binding protein [Rhodocyclaceae bacterium]
MSAHSAFREDTRATLRRLIQLRWWLLGGGAAAVAAVPAWLGIDLPLAPLFAALALMAGFNAHAAKRLAAGETPTTRMLAMQVAVDLVVLGVLLFLSGGGANPLVSLLLLPVATAALVLPARWTAVAAVAAVALYSFLFYWFVPLQVGDAQRATSLHLAGMWLTFAVSAVLIAWLIVRMTASIRSRDAALAAAREQALRDERVIALGALAAGAAHELGTPLATIAVLAEELEAEPAMPEAARADLALLRRQVAACKGIVTGLAERAGAARLEGARALAADRWAREAVARWQSTRPRAACALTIDGTLPAPQLAVDETLEQALANLLNNAANASADAVELRLDWNGERFSAEVADRGPGFPEEVLAQAGRAPLASTTGGAGIGLLLACAAVSRFGGRLTLANRGGAVARIELPLSHARPSA